MEPKTLSASAIHVAELCMDRYEAEYLDRGRGIAHSAATLGSTVHLALEWFVTAVYLKKEHVSDGKLLQDLFRMAYMQTFGSADFDTEDYADGVEMLNAWLERTDFSDRTVLSCEVKTNFPIPTAIGDIPFNYIWDRCDQTGETEFTVVDYKTSRWNVRPEDLKKKIQVRSYGLAAQIQFPQATRIRVELDMLRHNSTVGVYLTRDDNIATWKFLKEKAKQIVEAPPGLSEPTLNQECRFCVKKAACPALQKNISVGGIFGVTIEKAIDIRAQLEFQKAAVTSAINELDEMILSTAKSEDRDHYESEENNLDIGVRITRGIDAERVEMVLGPEKMKKYGSTKITLGVVDKLLKANNNEITDDQKRQLKGLIFKSAGEPSVKVSPKNPIDED